MSSQVRELMTSDVATVGPHTLLVEAARMMRDKNIGDVVLTDGTEPLGILTDRDIAIRAVAGSRDPEETEVGEVASHHLKTLGPEDTIDDAIALVQGEAVRRIPVVEGGSLVGILSIGDLARERDPQS